MTLRLKRTVEPAAYPLTLNEVQQHLREPEEDEGTLATLQSLIALATSEAERITWRQLITATWAYTIDDWPGDDIVLPKPPLASVTHIKYVNTSGVLTTLPATEYVVDTTSEPGRVLLGYGKSWPPVRAFPNAITITYQAGYGSSGNAVPIGIRQAMLLFIGHYFANREQIVFESFIPKELPLGAIDLLLAHRAHYPAELLDTAL